MAVKTGSIVKLKSGGPVMTAGSEYGDGFRCHWFVQSELKEGKFEAAELEEVDKEGKPVKP